MTDYLDAIIRAGTCRKPKGYEHIEDQGYRMQQSPRELAEFCQWIDANNIRSYLEIGVRGGGTWTLLSDLHKFERTCAITIDESEILRKPEGGELLIADSTSAKAIEWAKEHGPFDLIFVDALHTYKNVMADYINYKPLARYIALHDILFAKGAIRAWSEICPGDDWLTTIKDEEITYGIGIMRGGAK